MKKDHGFSLLESLVGLTIIAVILLALLQIGRNSAAQVKRAEEATIAANLAKTIFSSAGVEYPLQPGTQNGKLNSDWSWELIITERYQPNTAQLISKTDLQLLDLKTLVFNANTIYEFKTVRSSRKQAFK